MPGVPLSDLDQRLLSRLSGNDAFYPDEARRRAINEAQCVVYLTTALAQGWFDDIGAGRAGCVFYRIPPEISIVTAIEYDGKELGKTSLRAVASHDRRWMLKRSSQRDPVARWGHAGFDKIFLYPAPNVSGRDIRFYGIPRVLPLSAPEHRLKLPNEASDLILEYATQPLMLRESGNVFVSSARALQGLMSRLKGAAFWAGFKNPRYWIADRQGGRDASAP